MRSFIDPPPEHWRPRRRPAAKAKRWPLYAAAPTLIVTSALLWAAAVMALTSLARQLF